LEIEIPVGPDPSAILSIEAIVAGYSKMTILNETTFDVARGAITAIIGPNGAGKSTVFRAVFGLLPVRAGRILFEGRDITNATPRQLLDLGICLVPQGRNLFPQLSVRHNIELGGMAMKNSRDLSRRLDAALDRFPVLRRKADAQASTLSGGEQKLLEIARGLLLEPALMLIDEPSIGLSPLMVQETFAILESLRAAGVSILMVEQNARAALELSDFGIVLEQGRTRIAARAHAILADQRLQQLFLGGALEGDAA
jgi:branched-chain amino acid transport system ATP-binding protein